ncbi:MAG: hypothetical protein HKN70_02545 [Gammaproteobacteria bacterium]|nr:hypothetical protein [Gammaproteobacteria bacterium]
MRTLLFASLVALLTLPTSGASLSITDLPSSFLAGNVSIDITDDRVYSQYQQGGFSAYAFTRDGESRFLMQYDIFAPTSYWISGALFGRVFVDIATAYDLTTDGHEINVYFDQLIPPVGDQFFLSGVFGGSTAATMVLDADGIAGGSGFYRREEYPDQVESGNLGFLDTNGNPDGPFVCLECGIEFTFNLVFLDFSSGYLNFNFADTRPDLISAIDWFEGSMPYGYNLNIAVQAVPLPAAWVLLGGALFILRLLSRN